MKRKGFCVAPFRNAEFFDLSQAETLKCEYCNNVLFISSTIIKRLSAIISPTGQEALVPIDVYSCGNCGKVPKSMLGGTGIEDV